MLKQTVLSAILIAASAASPLVLRQDSGVVVTSPDTSQEVPNVITAFTDDVNTVGPPYKHIIGNRIRMLIKEVCLYQGN